MTQDEIDKIALRVWKRVWPYSNQWAAPQVNERKFIELFREGVAEIQRTQKPTLMMNSVHNTEAVLEDQTSGFEIPLFTFPPAPVVPENPINNDGITIIGWPEGGFPDANYGVKIVMSPVVPEGCAIIDAAMEEHKDE